MKDETIADLKQEKSYMETKVSRLERQIENFYNREDKKKDQVVELQTQLNKVRLGKNEERLINV